MWAIPWCLSSLSDLLHSVWQSLGLPCCCKWHYMNCPLLPHLSSEKKKKKTTSLCVPFPAHREHFSGQICVSLQSHCTTLLLAFLITKYVVLFPHQTILWQQLGILQFNLILILSTWRWHQSPQVKGPDPQDCFPSTSDASHKSRLLPGIWPLAVSCGSLEPTRVN